MRIALGLSAALLAGQPALARAPAAELLLRNGHVYTATAAHPWASAVAIRDGRILAVGNEAALRRYTGPRTRVIDLHRAMVMPGLVDSHSHPIAGGRQLTLADLGGREVDLAGLRAFLDASLANGLAMHKGVAIIVGVPPSLWTADLAGVFNHPPYDHLPLLLAGWDGHTGWANAALLARSGAGDAAALARLPAEERAGFRVDAAGQPTGFATEGAALGRLRAALPGHDGHYDPAWLTLAERYYNRHGVTAVLDANTSYWPEDGEGVLPLYAEAARHHALTLHVAALMEARSPGELPRIIATRDRLAGLRDFAVVGVKVFVDGVVEYPAQTAFVLTPYPNSGQHGAQKLPQATMDTITKEADAHGLLVHFHAIGDGAVRAALDSIAAARRTDPAGTLPHTLAHLQLIDPADIPRFHALGAVASFQLLWAQEDGIEAHETRLAPATWRAQYPARDVAEAGGLVAGGSDWPVTSGNPWEAIAIAMSRKGPFGVLPGGKMTLEPMLRAYTINAARALRLEQSIGSLEPGKQADLIVLDRDVTRLPPEAIAQTRVRWTMLGGRVVWRDH